MDYPIAEHIQKNLSNINGMAKTIRSLNQSNIVLCCRGSSGAMIAALIAQKLKKGTCKIVHFKKPGEISHSMYFGHCFLDDPYIIIIDDFAITGETINKIYEAIRKHTQKKIDCVCLDYINCNLKFEVDILITGMYE